MEDWRYLVVQQETDSGCVMRHAVVYDARIILQPRKMASRLNLQRELGIMPEEAAETCTECPSPS